MQISFAVTAKLISAFVFATWIVQFLFYLNPKFQASSSFLCLYRSVCVRPVRKPHCWFSHEAAHMYSNYWYFIRRTCSCNEYHLKTHFYTLKLGFAVVYLFSLFLLQNIDCVYPQSMFLANIKIIKNFLLKIFIFFTTLKTTVYCMGKFSYCPGYYTSTMKHSCSFKQPISNLSHRESDVLSLTQHNSPKI